MRGDRNEEEGGLPNDNLNAVDFRVRREAYGAVPRVTASPSRFDSPILASERPERRGIITTQMVRFAMRRWDNVDLGHLETVRAFLRGCCGSLRHIRARRQHRQQRVSDSCETGPDCGATPSSGWGLERMNTGHLFGFSFELAFELRDSNNISSLNVDINDEVTFPFFYIRKIRVLLIYAGMTRRPVRKNYRDRTNRVSFVLRLSRKKHGYEAREVEGVFIFH